MDGFLKMTKYLIYKITNLVNNKIYIGMTKNTINKRWSGHVCNSLTRNNNLPLNNAIRKYGKENFKIEILIDNLNESEAIEKENELIKSYNSQNIEIGYNLCSGGKGGKGLFGEKNGMFGKTHSLKTRKRLSEVNIGKKHAPHTEESKLKISLSNKGKIGYWRGKKRSLISKEKMSISKKKDWEDGKYDDPEYRKKLSESKIGKKSWSYKIRCNETGIEYLSFGDCAKAMNLDQGNISKQVQGKSKTVKGYTFQKIN